MMKKNYIIGLAFVVLMIVSAAGCMGTNNANTTPHTSAPTVSSHTLNTSGSITTSAGVVSTTELKDKSFGYESATIDIYGDDARSTHLAHMVQVGTDITVTGIYPSNSLTTSFSEPKFYIWYASQIHDNTYTVVMERGGVAEQLKGTMIVNGNTVTMDVIFAGGLHIVATYYDVHTI